MFRWCLLGLVLISTVFCEDSKNSVESEPLPSSPRNTANLSNPSLSDEQKKLKLIDELNKEAVSLHEALVAFANSPQAKQFENTPFSRLLNDALQVDAKTFANFVNSDDYDRIYIDMLIAKKKAREFQEDSEQGLALTGEESEVEKCTVEKMQKEIDKESAQETSHCTKENQTITDKIKDFFSDDDKTGGTLLMITGLVGFVGGSYKFLFESNKAIKGVGVAQLSIGLALVYVGNRMTFGDDSQLTKDTAGALMVGAGTASAIGGIFTASHGIQMAKAQKLGKFGSNLVDKFNSATSVNISKANTARNVGIVMGIAGVAVALLGAYDIYHGMEMLGLTNISEVELVKKLISSEREIFNLKTQINSLHLGSP